MGKEPCCIGVPSRTPVAKCSVKPLGSVPLNTVKLTVPCPPDCVKVWLNAVPAVPVVVPGLVTVMTRQLMGRGDVAPMPKQPFASVALTVIGEEPVCVGVPERPPPADHERSAGSVPLLSADRT